ncbi:hypothetical protein MTO96_030678, partial [Rhipicephalus appendiculatus]
EAQLASQKTRLQRTTTGRALLRRLGYQDSIRELDRTVDIPDEIRSTFKVAPIPKRMHPTDHQGRRSARAQSISKTYQNRKNAVYVDAATYMNGKDAVVTMIDAQLKEKFSASLKNCTVSDAEEAAVALAVAEGNRSGQSLIIITDSQDACRGYTNGSLVLSACQLNSSARASASALASYRPNRQQRASSGFWRDSDSSPLSLDLRLRLVDCSLGSLVLSPCRLNSSARASASALASYRPNRQQRASSGFWRDSDSSPLSLDLRLRLVDCSLAI